LPLALVYQGHQGNSSLGQGWALQGIAYIQKVGQEARPGVGLQLGYRLVLKGKSYRLLNTGIDAANPDAAPDLKYWQTEEESYLRIVKDPGSALWTITDRSGVQSSFGGNPKSIVGNVSAWGRVYLTQIKYPQGTSANTIDYIYAPIPDVSTNVRSDAYVQTISWSGGQVVFNWETRPDPYAVAIPTSATNEGIVVDQRVKSVEVRLGALPIRRYEVGYDESPDTPLSHNKVSLLTSVTEKGADMNNVNPSSFPSTVFKYSYPPSQPNWVSNGPITGDPLEPLGPGTDGGNCSRMIDWNYDGWLDVVVGNPGGYKVYLSKGSPVSGRIFQPSVAITSISSLPQLCSFESQRRRTTTPQEHSNIVANAGAWQNVVRQGGQSVVSANPLHDTELVDIDGDGRPDLLHRPGSRSAPVAGTWVWYKNEGNNKFGPATNLGNPPIGMA